MLNRLRRHRLLWVLALTVLSFKLVAGTICLNDTVANPHAAAVATTVAAQAASALNPVFDDSRNACLLGETGGCHCACPESLPVPATISLALAPVGLKFTFHAPAYAFSPTRTNPLLRPPIA
ncbi:MAG TPA: hypothetical protein VFQ88_16185 [Nevskiaceae bacterium]|nr:hypothetical protein [Nevskiaceae bacterium]